MIQNDLDYTEKEQIILCSEDPTKFSDKELADLWKKEWRRKKSYCEGDYTVDTRLNQASAASTLIEKMIEDLRKVAKTKINTHRTKCLKLITNLEQVNHDLRTYFNTYLEETGLIKHLKKRYKY